MSSIPLKLYALPETSAILSIHSIPCEEIDEHEAIKKAECGEIELILALKKEDRFLRRLAIDTHTYLVTTQSAAECMLLALEYSKGYTLEFPKF